MTLAPTVAIIVAGGTGERFGRKEGKQMLAIDGVPVLALTVRPFLAASLVDSLVVVCHPDRVDEYREAVERFAVASKPIAFTAGGATRQESVAAGLSVAERLGASAVAVHDGARPLVTQETIDRALAMLRDSNEVDGVVVGHPVTDTLKIANGELVEQTPDRSRYWAVQTPQCFDAPVLRAALDAAAGEGFTGTDDASLVERAGGRVALALGSRDNMKITVAEDAAIARAILAWRTAEEAQ